MALKWEITKKSTKQELKEKPDSPERKQLQEVHADITFGTEMLTAAEQAASSDVASWNEIVRARLLAGFKTDASLVQLHAALKAEMQKPENEQAYLAIIQGLITVGDLGAAVDRIEENDLYNTLSTYLALYDAEKNQPGENPDFDAYVGPIEERLDGLPPSKQNDIREWIAELKSDKTADDQSYRSSSALQEKIERIERRDGEAYKNLLQEVLHQEDAETPLNPEVVLTQIEECVDIGIAIQQRTAGEKYPLSPDALGVRAFSAAESLLAGTPFESWDGLFIDVLEDMIIAWQKDGRHPERIPPLFSQWEKYTAYLKTAITEPDSGGKQREYDHAVQQLHTLQAKIAGQSLHSAQQRMSEDERMGGTSAEKSAVTRDIKTLPSGPAIRVMRAWRKRWPDSQSPLAELTIPSENRQEQISLETTEQKDHRTSFENGATLVREGWDAILQGEDSMALADAITALRSAGFSREATSLGRQLATELKKPENYGYQRTYGVKKLAENGLLVDAIGTGKIVNEGLVDVDTTLARRFLAFVEGDWKKKKDSPRLARELQMIINPDRATDESVAGRHFNVREHVRQMQPGDRDNCLEDSITLLLSDPYQHTHPQHLLAALDAFSAPEKNTLSTYLVATQLETDDPAVVENMKLRVEMAIAQDEDQRETLYVPDSIDALIALNQDSYAVSLLEEIFFGDPDHDPERGDQLSIEYGDTDKHYFLERYGEAIAKRSIVPEEYDIPPLEQPNTFIEEALQKTSRRLYADEDAVALIRRGFEKGVVRGLNGLQRQDTTLDVMSKQDSKDLALLSETLRNLAVHGATASTLEKASVLVEHMTDTDALQQKPRSTEKFEEGIIDVHIALLDAYIARNDRADMNSAAHSAEVKRCITFLDQHRQDSSEAVSLAKIRAGLELQRVAMNEYTELREEPKAAAVLQLTDAQ